MRWLSGPDAEPLPFQAPFALDILKARYARDEIDREEYQNKKRDLES